MHLKKKKILLGKEESMDNESLFKKITNITRYKLKLKGDYQIAYTFFKDEDKKVALLDHRSNFVHDLSIRSKDLLKVYYGKTIRETLLKALKDINETYGDELL